MTPLADQLRTAPRWPRLVPPAFAILAALAAGSASAAPTLLDDAAERYRPMMIENVNQAMSGAQALSDRIAAGDLDGAKHAWIDARIGWERAEVFTTGFVSDLDQEIDAWPNAFTGFHAVEAKLFGAGRLDAKTETENLLFHLEDLQVKIREMPLTPQGLLNGMARLAYEVGENKSGGGESRLSGTSLNDMQNNIAGIAAAYRIVFADALNASDAALARSVQGQIDKLGTLLAVKDLRQVDAEKLRTLGEELVVTLQNSAPPLGLRKVSLEELLQQ